MLYTLDTNIIIDFFHNDEITVQKIKELEEQQVSLSISIITLCELYKGIYLCKKQELSLNALTILRQRIETLGVTEESAKIYGQKYAELKAQGKPTQDFDLIIASTCMANNAVLVTQNAKDFVNIRGLKAVEW